MISYMIAKKGYKLFCDDVTKVENYDIAVSSKERYVLHHRRETVFTMDELIEIGEYFHRPPDEFIFLTYSQHRRLHQTVCKGAAEWMFKIGSRLRGKKMPEKERKAIKERMKGMLYWNNGSVNVRSRECPGKGFVRGYLRH